MSDRLFGIAEEPIYDMERFRGNGMKYKRTYTDADMVLLQRYTEFILKKYANIGARLMVFRWNTKVNKKNGIVDTELANTVNLKHLMVYEGSHADKWYCIEIALVIDGKYNPIYHMEKGNHAFFNAYYNLAKEWRNSCNIL